MVASYILILIRFVFLFVVNQWSNNHVIHPGSDIEAKPVLNLKASTPPSNS